MSQNEVFRRFLEIHPVDLAGSAKINYSKSMRICQCTRHVQENSVWLPILCPKFRSCHAKISRSLGASRVMKNTSDWLRKRSFRDLGVILRVSNAFYMACSDKQYLFREQTLGKSCVIDATNFSQNAMSQNEVFRLFLETRPADLAGRAKINYSK